MHFSLMVNFFLLLLFVNFSYQTAVKNIPEFLSDVTPVVHLAERAGHRLMVQFDGLDKKNPTKLVYVGIGALNTERGWWFTHILMNNFPADESQNSFEEDVTFADDIGNLHHKTKDFWLLTEDFFKYERKNAEGFKGCDTDKGSDNKEAFHLVHNGKKFYMAAMRNKAKQNEKTIGTFVLDDGTIDNTFSSKKTGKFYGVTIGGEPLPAKEFGEGANSYGWVEFFCKERHNKDVW